jgi:hypothetical protein
MPSLQEIDTQCAASLAAASANPRLAEENVRGYIVLLSAHFQGFCRDLYTECAQIVVSRVRPTLQSLIQAQFAIQRTLDHGNPNLHNLKKDFDRFGFRLDLPADPANASRLQHLAAMNEWRNIAAHHGVVPAGGLPPLATLRNWWGSCDGLATSLDQIMYNQLRRLLRRQPWPP